MASEPTGRMADLAGLTPEERAANIMDEAMLGDPHVKNGVDAAIRKSIATAIQSAVNEEREACAQLCDGWVGQFQDRDIKYVSAQKWAVDAIEDIAEAIRSRSPTPAGKDKP